MATENSRATDNLWQQARSIPNILSYIRILLIPVFVLTYIHARYITAGCILVASGLTDIMDGRIARKFGMVTELGKIVDPAADKLTQAAMILCVSQKVAEMKILLFTLVVKEILMLLIGYLVYRKTNVLTSSRWFGKATTTVLYAVLIVYVLVPSVPDEFTTPATALCSAMIIMTFVLYNYDYLKQMKRNKKD
ncbi:MAG: CDP-alcohol phosphatidyltransferase family protein [Papillibacter sp.]|nr:CDP-alcohol phosphatidyltransferase family protein [Papillibacter sp.]